MESVEKGDTVFYSSPQGGDFPAIVTAVFPDGTVTLCVFYDDGQGIVGAVPYSARPKPSSWHWLKHVNYAV